ncbi:hypothetical protein B0T14DRAFT_496789 [Immersiella caudata]|uniref:Uncharacterized protein n=1 Tax=Immersiella caudata TaxID=314043 RepID=A0AA40BZX1_9PEZI|nr:hypothetical protein B0T14DRAFT_496789 [Immersiella caudata]
MSLPADAKTLLTSLKTVAENGSFQTFVDKALKLDTEIVELMGSKRVQDRQLQDAENKLKDAEERLKEREEQLSVSQATLKKKEEKISALQGQLRAQQKNNEDSLRSTKTALEAKSQKLSDLESYSLELKPVIPEDVESRFESLFQQAFELAKKSLDVDLGAESARWNGLRHHKAVKDKICFPSTDTPIAKMMRTAAFLAVLSSELSEHIFLSTYILEEAGELQGFLTSLAEREPELESHLRSVLLKAHLDEDKQSMAGSRTETAVKNVFECVEGLFLHRPQRESFRSDLEAICKQACDLWQYIQTLDDSITPNDGLFMLKLKILDFSSPPQLARNSKAPPNGGTSTQGPKTKLSTNDPQLVPERVVWPSLVTEEASLTHGYALSEDQVKKGKDEEKAEMARWSRREARRKSRATSMTENETETDSKRPFLSQKGGDGQKGA